jgi:hypothetical protein
MIHKRPILIIPGVLILLLLVYSLSLIGLFPWSPLNCETVEIDLYSGRSRYTRYLYWIPIKRVISDSALTKELTPEDLSGLPCEWQPVFTVSPRVRHSPHYWYHAALGQIRDIEDFWKRTGATKESRRFAAIQFLRLWQTGGTKEVQLFLDKMYEKLLEADKIPHSSKPPASDSPPLIE